MYNMIYGIITQLIRVLLIVNLIFIIVSKSFYHSL